MPELILPFVSVKLDALYHSETGGLTEGLAEGDNDGDSDGLNEGDKDGDNDGDSDADGDCEGLSDGDNDGLADGLSDGLKDGDNEGVASLFEGSHYETENDYMVIVYYRNPRERYDRIIGTATINTLNRLSY